MRVLYAKRLECEKSMESMASFHCSRLRWSRWDSSAVAALLDFPCCGYPGRHDKDSHIPYLNTVSSCLCGLHGMDLLAALIRALQKS